MIARRRIPPLRLVALLAAVTAVVCGCGRTDAHEGWGRFNANGLRGAYPSDWAARAEEQRVWPDAVIEVAGPRRGTALEPVLVVYAEEGPVIGVEARAALISARLEEELAARVVDRADARVRGAAEGLLLEFAFDAEAAGSADPVPSRQFELMLDTADGRTFDVMLGGPADALDQATIDGVLNALVIQ